MFKIIWIINPGINWKEYLVSVHDVLGRSPTEKFDANWINLTHSVSDFLSTLKEIESPGSNLKAFPGALMDHVSFSCLVIASNELASKIITVSRLTCTDFGRTVRDDFRLLLVSGTLTQYRTCVINCCVDGLPCDIQEFGTAILTHFKSIDQFSIGLLEFRKSDGTIRVLEERR